MCFFSHSEGFSLNHALGLCFYPCLMKGRLAFLARWYDAVKAAARHKRAEPTLAALALAESSIFPLIPVDVMVIPMVQARPERWMRIAAIAAFFSVMGGVIGYGLGYAFFEILMEPLLAKLGKADKIGEFEQIIGEHGGLGVFFAGLTPFPFIIITVMSGALKVNFAVFIIASTISRTLRFFLVAGIVRAFGNTAERWLKQHFALFTFGLFALIAALYFGYRALTGH